MFLQQPYSLQSQMHEYHKSRVNLTPNCTSKQQQPMLLKETRRDTTPTKENREFFESKSNQKGTVSVSKISQFPVQMHHIRLNQLGENYSSHYQVVQSIDMTPQRALQKAQQPNIPVFKQSQCQPISQATEIQNNLTRINMNLNLKQCPQQTQHPLRQINQNSSSKTPIGSSQKNVADEKKVTDSSEELRKTIQLRDYQLKQLEGQIKQIKTDDQQKISDLQEELKKTSQLKDYQVKSLENQIRQNKITDQNKINELQEELKKAIQLKDYQVKSLENQLKQNKITDLKRITELQQQLDQAHQMNEEMNEDINQLKMNRDEVLEMNKSLERELRNVASSNTTMSQEIEFIQGQLQEIYRENTELKRLKSTLNKVETQTEETRLQLKHLDSVQKTLTIQWVEAQKNVNPIYNSEEDSVETDVSDQYLTQIQQLKEVIELHKMENQMLYLALHKKAIQK